MASALFGGLPATGALARTAANVKAGARSPISGIVHAGVVLGVILVGGPVAVYTPLPTLAAVLVVVAINMGEWKNFTYLPGWPDKDAQLFLLAFSLTLLQVGAAGWEQLGGSSWEGAILFHIINPFKPTRSTLNGLSGRL